MAQAPALISVSESPRHRPITAVVRERTEDKKLTTDPKGHAISVTATSQWSCHEDCAFLTRRNDDDTTEGGGCYAEIGNMRFVTGRLNASTERIPEAIARVEADGIRKLTGENPLRLKLVGDTKTDAAARIVAEACDEYHAKHNQPVWTYTHAWRRVERASHGNVSVLASCETEDDVRQAVDRGYATAMVCADAASVPAEIAGTKPILCRQQTGEALDCARCTLRGPLCALDDNLRGRRTIVFLAHGPTRKVRDAIATRRSNG